MNRLFLVIGLLIFSAGSWAQNPTVAEEPAPVQEQAPAVKAAPETAKPGKAERDLARKKKKRHHRRRHHR